MIQIDCPWCGPRDEIEFRWGGESHVVRPDEQADAASWTAYLFLHDNRMGANFERWHHEFGCRRWFNVVRDTTSHAVLKTYPIDAPKPDGLS